ncbi:mitochondrial transcription termination factor 5 isoform X2 [Rhynchophorus ferrugineus]|uniref:mitochondrial transcription termination factor 5 isoform X2 n=1 Tax=Rhynchophorus ferrugineus TaxID=354439 RepID=UPI003FCE573E
MMLYQNINIQLYSYNRSISLIKRYTSNYESNVKVFMDLFKLPKNKAEKFIRKHPILAFKEPEHIRFSYDFCKKIGYANQDMLKYTNLLTLHHLIKVQHYWALEETGCHNIHPKLLSRAVYYFKRKIVCLKYQNFLKPEVDVVEKFLSYLNPPIKRPEKLQEYNIPDEHIQRKHQIFTMNVDSIKSRLMEIKQKKELQLVLEFNNILHVVIHQKKITSRLSYLQKLKMRCASFKLFGHTDDAYFDNYIKEGKDINMKSDLINFLAVLFQQDKKDISKKISVHPLCQYVPFIDMQATYDFLIKTGFSKDNIYRVLPILLYPIDKIKNAVKTIKTDPDTDYYILNQYQILNLIIYELEKVHHFTGNGIWTMENVTDEQQFIESE